MLPVLVFLTESLSSGQITSSISKVAFTSLSNLITTDAESVHTPLLTNNFTLFVLDAEAIMDAVGVKTAGKLFIFHFQKFTSWAPLCEKNTVSFEQPYKMLY